VVPRPMCPGCAVGCSSVRVMSGSFGSGVAVTGCGSACPVRWLWGESRVVAVVCAGGRLDVIDTVGEVIGGWSRGRRGAPGAVRADVPHTTARTVASVPRAGPGAGSGFSVLAVELGDAGWPTAGSPTRPVRRSCARRRLASGAGPGAEGTGRWAFAGLVTGGRLLSTTIDPPGSWSAIVVSCPRALNEGCREGRNGQGLGRGARFAPLGGDR